MMNNTNTMLLQYVDPRGCYEKYIDQDIRPCGRALHCIRPFVIKKHVFNNNNNCGSSYIELGNTKVSCGIKILVGTPSLHKPTWGDTDIDVNMWPISSPKYDHKSKSDIALVLESQLQSLIMDTKMIDLSKLCIEEGKAAFRLRISLVLLSDAGNLFDALVLALVSALNDVKLPNTIIDENSGDVTISEEYTIPLPLLKIPMAVTIGIFNNKIITDLDENEEFLMHGFITIVFDEKDQICYLHQYAANNIKDQKPGFNMQIIKNAISICHSKAIEIRQRM